MNIASEQSDGLRIMDDSIGTSKKRQYPCQTTIPTAYRLHFSCDYTGKYRSSTKRKLVWRFGFTNLASVRQGKEGSDCRGEEHEVVLIWSVKSGKTKVFWNKSDISHFFREKQQFDKVEFSWEPRSGDRFQIIAHAKPTPTSSQYNFIISDTSFFSLPHVSELRGMEGGVEIADPTFADAVSVSEPSVEIEICDEDWVDPEDQEDCEDQPQSMSFRLAMAGLTPSERDFGFDELEDELTCDVFTNTLESLRHRVTTLIPDTEDMVSRAIINVFSEDRDSMTSFDSSSSCDSVHQTSTQIEVDAIWETNAWVALNVACAPRPDVEDQKRMFMQKEIDSVFMHVRHERLTEEAAIAILSSVATLLGTRLNNPIPEDTLILSELDKHVDVEALINSLCVYGEVKEAAVSKGRHFGICRFCNIQGLDFALDAAEKGSLVLNGKKPVVSLLGQPLIRDRPNMLSRRTMSLPNTTLEKPALTRRRSHQRNSITIDSVLTQTTPFLGLVNAIPLVTPDRSRTILRPNVFTNIPARSPPLIFDASVVSPEAVRYSPMSMLVVPE